MRHMKLEQLSSDRLKVALSAVDLDKYALDYFSISKNSPGTRQMLQDILNEARQRSGFSLKNAKLLIEVIPAKNDGCILYLTRLLPGKAARVRPVRRSAAESSAAETEEPLRNADDGYIVCCDSIDDALGAVGCFGQYPDVPLRESSLYSYGGKYHLLFAPDPLDADPERVGSLIASLSEYGRTALSGPVQAAVLSEHGCPISTGAAVEHMLQYFR